MDQASELKTSSNRAKSQSADLGVLWAATALVGILTISFVPIPVGSARPWLRMTLPIVVMCLYALLAFRRAVHARQHVADSVYFMGFLWTLWALIDALLTSPRPDSTLIYSAFGYALLGTFAGMSLRLLIMQFTRTVEDQELEARDVIDARVTELDNALSFAASNTRLFAESLSPAGEELRSALKAAVIAWSSEASAASKTVSEEAKKGIIEGSAALNAALSSSAEQAKMISGQLQTVNAEIKEPALALTKDLRRLSVSTGKQVEDLNVAFLALVATVTGLPNSPELQRALSDIAERADALANALNGASQGVTGGSAAVQNAARELVSASAEATHGVRTASAAAGQVVQASAAATAATGQLVAATTSAKSAAESVDNTLREVVNFVDRRVVGRN